MRSRAACYNPEMRTLYHLPFSPFARRVRLCLAHKGLDAVLKDVRASDENMAECRRLSPLKTVPVLVEPDGRVLGDSTAISRYLDAAYPSERPLWPSAPDEAYGIFEIASLCDVVLDNIVNLGYRMFSLRNDDAWLAVKGDMLERSQRALDALAARVQRLERPSVSRAGWSAPDICIYTMTAWLDGLPARAQAGQPLPGQLVSLGWKLPQPLVAWAAQHRGRPAVRALAPQAG